MFVCLVGRLVGLGLAWLILLLLFVCLLVGLSWLGLAGLVCLLACLLGLSDSRPVPVEVCWRLCHISWLLRWLGGRVAAWGPNG